MKEKSSLISLLLNTKSEKHECPDSSSASRAGGLYTAGAPSRLDQKGDGDSQLLNKEQTTQTITATTTTSTATPTAHTTP